MNVGTISVGAFSTSVYTIGGIAINSATAVAIAGAATGFVAGFSMAAFNGASVNDSFKAGFKGAISGAITGGVAGYYGDTYSLSRVAADGISNGLAARVNGGSFEDGFKVGLTVSLATYTTVKLRERELAHSRLKPGQVGDSPGIRGRPGKVGGGRLVDTEWKKYGQPILDETGSYEKAIQNYWDKVDSSYLGCHQGSIGCLISDSISYKPGSIADFVVESYGGPHDSLNHWYHYHDTGPYAGMAIGGRGTLGYVFGEVLSGVNVLVATPIAVPSMVPDYLRWQLYQH